MLVPYDSMLKWAYRVVLHAANGALQVWTYKNGYEVFMGWEEAVEVREKLASYGLTVTIETVRLHWIEVDTSEYKEMVPLPDEWKERLFR